MVVLHGKPASNSSGRKKRRGDEDSADGHHDNHIPETKKRRTSLVIRPHSPTPKAPAPNSQSVVASLRNWIFSSSETRTAAGTKVVISHDLKLLGPKISFSLPGDVKGAELYVFERFYNDHCAKHHGPVLVPDDVVRYNSKKLYDDYLKNRPLDSAMLVNPSLSGNPTCHFRNLLKKATEVRKKSTSDAQSLMSSLESRKTERDSALESLTKRRETVKRLEEALDEERRAVQVCEDEHKMLDEDVDQDLSDLKLVRVSDIDGGCFLITS